MIIGITGTDGAGKGVVVDYLVAKRGFVHYSARQLFIEEIERRGLSVNRGHMRLVANTLRAEHGNDFLVTVYLERMTQEEASNAIIESIRAVAEAQTLKAHGGVLVAVDANQRLRYERIRARASQSDAVTFEEFVAHEALEMHDPDPNGMQKAAVIAMADYTLLNDDTLEVLYAQIDTLLSEIDG